MIMLLVSNHLVKDPFSEKALLQSFCYALVHLPWQALNTVGVIPQVSRSEVHDHGRKLGTKRQV